MSSESTILVLGDSTLLYQVQGGVQTLLSQGPLELCNTASGHVIAKVNDLTWTLDKSMPCLRSDDHTYTFAISMPSGPVTFYCVILQKEVSAADIEVLQSVLATSTAYSGNPAAVAAEAGAPGAAAPGTEAGYDGYRQETGSQGYGYADPYQAQPQQQAQGSTLKRGVSMISSGLSWMGGVASAGVTAAREKAETSMTPETRAKLEAAKERAKVKLDALGVFAGRVATDVKEATANLVTKVNSEVGRNESLRAFSRSGKDVLSAVYRDMQKAGDTVLAKVRGTGSGAGAAETSGGSDAVAGHSPGVTGYYAHGHAPADFYQVPPPAPGVPVGAPAQGVPVAGQQVPTYYPAVPMP